VDPGDPGTTGLRAVADTNVLAYYLLRTEPFYEEARSFWQATEEVWAPDSWRIELLNVLWLAVRAGVLQLPQAELYITRAESLVTNTYPVMDLAEAAIRLAVSHQHPAYDTAFVALATRKNLPLATFDGKVLERFPEQASLPSAILRTIKKKEEANDESSGP